MKFILKILLVLSIIFLCITADLKTALKEWSARFHNRRTIRSINRDGKKVDRRKLAPSETFMTYVVTDKRNCTWKKSSDTFSANDLGYLNDLLKSG